MENDISFYRAVRLIKHFPFAKMARSIFKSQAMLRYSLTKFRCVYFGGPVLLMAIFLISGCLRIPMSHVNDLAEDPSEEQILRLIEAMPDWTNSVLLERCPEYRQEIEKTLGEIAKANTRVIRSAMQKYQKTHWKLGLYYEAGNKLFVINKYLFSLPENVRRDSSHARYMAGAWFLGVPVKGDPRNPKPSDEFDFRWPWSSDDREVWHLTGKESWYFGGPYEAMRDFDYYVKNFGNAEIQR